MLRPILAAQEHVKATVGDAAYVTQHLTPATAGRLPLVLLSVSGATTISNGRLGDSARFTIAASCYARTFEGAHDLAWLVYEGMVKLSESTFDSEFGKISKIGHGSLQPFLSPPDLPDDDVFRVNTVLQVTAHAGT